MTDDLDLTMPEQTAPDLVDPVVWPTTLTPACHAGDHAWVEMNP